MKAKRIMATVLCITAMAAFTACGVPGKGDNPAGASSISGSDQVKENDEGVIVVGEDESTWSPNAMEEKGSVEIPNPWIECQSLDEAEKLVGYSFQVPEVIAGYEKGIIEVLEQRMIQMIYVNGEESVVIRKALSAEDPSGDFNEYAEETTISVGENQVTMKGENGMVNLAIWFDGEYAYSVNTPEMSAEDVAALVEQVK
ncbi:MAG: hypothetical protein Q4B85_07260 [Lachnospiraceae bacterium]|nr:hypothetical protein [Lachnospiraceae bacterium]